MKIYYIIGVSFLVLCLNLLFPRNLNAKPTNLLNSLHDNNVREVIGFFK